MIKKCCLSTTKVYCLSIYDENISKTLVALTPSKLNAAILIFCKNNIVFNNEDVLNRYCYVADYIPFLIFFFGSFYEK